MERYLKKSEVWAYAFGLFGLQCIIGLINSYQTEFYNKILGVVGNSLTYIAVILLLSKLFSAFFDPFMGNIIDRSKFKSGCLRPFILISIVPLIILTVLIFVKVPFTGVGLYAYIFVIFFLWSLSMSFADIPSQSMLAVLTPSGKERDSVAGIANFLKNIGLSLPMVLVLAISLVFGKGETTYPVFLISAAFISLMGGGLFVLIYFKNKEAIPYKSDAASFKDMLIGLKNNKFLLLVVLCNLLGFGRNMAMGIQAQAANVLVGAVNIGPLHLSGNNTIVILSVTSAIGSMISMAVCPALCKRFGVKKVFIAMGLYGLTVCSLGYIVFYFFTKSLASILCFRFLQGLMLGTYGYAPMIMVSDCVDYYEWKTGKRNDGVQFSLLSMSIKVANALSVAVGIFMVGLAGYDSNALAFSDSTKNIIYAAFILGPGIASGLSVIPICFYKLTGKYKEKITSDLKERRAATDAENGGI